MVATLLFIIVVSKSKASLVTGITAVYPCVTIMLATLFLKETITLKQFFVVLLSVAGVLLIAL